MKVPSFSSDRERSPLTARARPRATTANVAKYSIHLALIPGWYFQSARILPKEMNKSPHLSKPTSGWFPTRAGFAKATKTDMVTACKAHRVLRHAHSVRAAIVARSEEHTSELQSLR